MQTQGFRTGLLGLEPRRRLIGAIDERFPGLAGLGFALARIEQRREAFIEYRETLRDF